GYAVSLIVELQPVSRYVAVRHVSFPDAASCTAAISRIAADGHYRDEPVDFLDGVVFSPAEQYLTLGRFTDTAPAGLTVSDYTGRDIYYRSIQRPGRDRSEGFEGRDLLTTHDYIWRWDTDWFWCSRALGVQHPVGRALWPRRYRRSDVYRRLVALDRRHQLSA